jgi:NAD(P)-dependent dehydrogenase (short-subunit alcohol dehydrogenase family)
MAMQVLVIGASRGIGLEFVRQYAAQGAQVTATARDDAGHARAREAGAARTLALDVAEPASASQLAWALDGSAFDIVVHNAGVIGPRLDAPEAPTRDDFDAVMRANVHGAMLVLPQLADALAPGGRAKLVVISSKMGSLGLRSNGAIWLYRASKAALNSVLKDLSFAFGGRAVCAALHPGWVKTDMGGAGADLDVATSVASLRRTIAALGSAQHGGYFDHDGTPLAW